MDSLQPVERALSMKRTLVIAAFLAFGLLSATRTGVADELSRGFQTPPDSARPWVWWFWLNNNVSKESITADLKELKAKGIGGVTVYSLAALRGPVASGPAFMSPDWRGLFRHTVREADRLGLGVSLIPCSGWNAGGPWMTADDACKKLVQSKVSVRGPRKFAEKLPQPPALERYWDVNLQAFPTLPPNTARQTPAEQHLLAVKSAQDSAGDLPGTPIRQLHETPLTELKTIPGEPAIDPAKVIDLTAHLAPDGTLTWDVPKGEWTILRTGCTLNGTRTQCGAPGNDGWDADPLRAAAIENHFKNTTEILLRDVGNLAGKTFRSVQIDSWEINVPNWSQTFLKDFRRLRGYDAGPYLATLSGNIVGNAEITDRFLHDYRKTLADCVAEHYFGRFTELAHARNCLNQSEAAGPCYPKTMPLDALKNLGRCDIPMGEFWQDNNWGGNGPIINGKQTASAAHIYGKRLVAAEAFTSFLQWADSPASLKPTADRAFCEGFNWLFIFSTATQQGDGTPGIEFHAGTHFNRKITWWNQAKSFTDYIARCSYLLQQGKFVADVCYYNGDGAPNLVEQKHVDPSLGLGYDYDVCNAEVLLARMAVRDGRIVLPDGMSYRLLVLPERKAMPVEVLRKIRELVAAGATVVGPKPERDSGLKNYPQCDAEIKRLADELWGPCDGRSITEHRFGKGRVVWGQTLRDVLAANHVPPDFAFTGGGNDAFIDFIHRTTGNAEIYFLANRSAREETVNCTFRVDGRLPELWDPTTGAMCKANAYVIADGRTTVPLRLPSYGSTFIVFRSPAPAKQNAGRNFETFKTEQELTGPWTVQFDPKWGGPKSVQFDQLVSWTNRPEDGVKFYSGTAVYRKTFDLAESARGPGKRIYLDLGVVRDLAEVRLNGKTLGTLWTAPWRIDITDTVKPTGNRLEIAVTNLWPNRLIGDAALPVEKRLAKTNIALSKDQPLLESGLLGPARIAAADPAPLAEASLWPPVTPECRPGVYWWWHGSAVNPNDLTRELERYHAAGIGAVHIIPIYGTKGYENQSIEYLSPKWMTMLRHCIREAKQRGMLVDMTLGTGWCFGGPNVPPEEGTADASIKTFSATGGTAWRQKFDPKSLEALAAFSTDGRWVDLKGRVNSHGVVQWTPDAGSWQVYAVLQVSGKQAVKRAAPGGTGPMLNPIYGQAVQHYVERFTRAFAENKGPVPRAFYHDSYEYQSNWSPDLLTEFAKRRGYRLESKLPSLAGKATDDHAARVNADYRETVSDLIVEKFTPVWIAWCRDHGALTRNQAHGSPANLLDLYAQSDIPETEMFHTDRNLFVSKFASSAAHTAGRRLTASETGTWLAPHFTETLGDVKDLVDWLFLSGVNHVFYHGACYSPDDAPWPGWVFYASTEMNPRNSIWRDVSALNAYAARCQSVLQAGKPDNDVLVYWPINDYWHSCYGPKLRGFSVHGGAQGPVWVTKQPIGDLSQRLWNRGYSFDYVSDRQLTGASVADNRVEMPGGVYRAVVVPPCDHIPVPTLAALTRLAEQGATIVFADRLPSDVPGAGDLAKRRAELNKILDSLKERLNIPSSDRLQSTPLGKGRILVGPVDAAMTAARVARETMTERPGLQFVRRRMPDGFYYFVVNRGDRAIDGWAPFGAVAYGAAFLDPMTGRTGATACRLSESDNSISRSKMQTSIYLQLAPGQSLIVRTFDDRPVLGPVWEYRRAQGKPVNLTGPWHVEFIVGGPSLPKPRDIDKLASWTEWNDPETERFGGTARYTTTFDVASPAANVWQINLGDVFQSAKVRLNGRDLGTVFTQPFRVNFDGSLKPKGNVLEIEVTNVSANRIRDMDRRGVKWKNFYDANVLNSNYKPLNAADWPLRKSGLWGPVLLEGESVFLPKE